VSLSASGLARAARHIAGLLLLLSSAVLLLVNGAFETPLVWSFLCPLTFALGLALLGVARPLALAWVVYVTGFLLFIKVRLIADDVSPLPPQFEYVIRLDELMFGGHLPTLVLQDRLYELGSPSWAILALVVVYVSYAIVPHLLALIVTLRNSLADLWRYIAASMICYHAAIAVAIAAPTAPPWMAGQEGYTRHIFRVTYDVIVDADPATYVGTYPIVDGNSVAAMPSLHMAIAVISGYGLVMALPGTGLVGVAYPILMGLALVALGEHYVIDILAGLLLAVLAWRMTGSVYLKRLRASREATGLDPRRRRPPPERLS